MILDKLLAVTPPEKEDVFKDLIQALNELVNLIENSPETTKGWYGAYLEHCATKGDVIYLLAAGANREGVMGAAMVNGLI